MDLKVFSNTNIKELLHGLEVSPTLIKYDTKDIRRLTKSILFAVYFIQSFQTHFGGKLNRSL